MCVRSDLSIDTARRKGIDKKCKNHILRWKLRAKQTVIFRARTMKKFCALHFNVAKCSACERTNLPGKKIV